MPDLRISDLPVLSEADLQAADDLAIVDYSASETKRLTAKALVEKGVTLIDDDSIPGAKIVGDSITSNELAPNSVGSSELSDDAVDTAAVQDDAITNDKVASGLDGAKLIADSLTATQIAPDAIGSSELANDAVDTAAVQDSAITDAKVAPGISGLKISADSLTAAQIAPNAIGSSELADDAVDTAAVQDEAITNDKILELDGSKLIAESVGTTELEDAGVTTDKIDSGAVTGPKLGAVTNRGLDQTGDQIGITNSVIAGSLAGLTFDEQGLITAAAAEIPATDLPVATSTEVGAIKPGTGLSVTGDGTLNLGGGGLNLQSNQDIGGLAFTDGLCTGFPAGAPPVFERDAIPIAGNASADYGAVYVPDDPAIGLDLNSTTGELIHEQSGAAAGTYASVDVDVNGHITGGSEQLSQDQLPNALPAEDIDTTNGKFPTVDATSEQGFVGEVVTEAIADRSIGRRHFNDISISYIQEEQPTSQAQPGSDATVFRGCMWLRPSTGTLYMYSGNNWIIVAGGKLAQENLRYCGNIDASTGNVVLLTDEGVSEQLESGGAAFTIGNPLPAADDGISGCYFLVSTAGSSINVTDVDGNNFQVGDLCLAISQAAGWTQVSGAFGGGGGGGDSLWTRTGAAPTATLTPDNAADNVNLTNSDFIRLPSASTADAPAGGIAGSFRWNTAQTDLNVYTGTAWQQLSHIDCGEY